MTTGVREVVVTGVGPVSAVGVGADDLWTSLVAGRTAVQSRTLPVDVAREVSLPLAAIPSDPAPRGLQPHLDFLAEQECAGYRDLAYAMLAVELALHDAGLSYSRTGNDLGVIQVFEAPGVEATVTRIFKLAGTPPDSAGPPQVYDPLAPSFYAMQPFLYVHLLGKAFGFHGLSTAVHNACSSSGVAIDLAAQQIRSGAADVMLVAGGEAFETAVRLEWFRRLELYATHGQMSPFEPQPNGFYVGEGAAAVVLESAKHASDRGATPYAVYRGGCFAQQSWKQVIPDVSRARLRDAIVNALRRAELPWESLDLVVPHGAATQLSDAYEAHCLSRALNGAETPAVATVFKPYTGHLLAASGLIELVCALLAMRRGAIPATPGSDPSRVRLPVPLAAECLARRPRTVLKLLTGFTGHDAALVFSAPS